jgi:hypothetical protein
VPPRPFKLPRSLGSHHWFFHDLGVICTVRGYVFRQIYWISRWDCIFYITALLDQIYHW